MDIGIFLGTTKHCSYLHLNLLQQTILPLVHEIPFCLSQQQSPKISVLYFAVFFSSITVTFIGRSSAWSLSSPFCSFFTIFPFTKSTIFSGAHTSFGKARSHLSTAAPKSSHCFVHIKRLKIIKSQNSSIWWSLFPMHHPFYDCIHAL